MFTTKIKSTSRSKLHEIPVPTRLPRWEKGEGERRFWAPLQHGELADSVINMCREAGLRVTSETWHTQRDGLALLGAVGVEPSDDLSAGSVRSFLDRIGEEHGTTNYHGRSFTPKGLSLVLGVRHSNDGRWAVQFTTGAKVLVCENGLILTKFVDTVRRRHHEDETVDDYVRVGIGSFLRAVPSLGSWTESMREAKLTGDEASTSILDMAEAGVYPWRDVQEVTAEWREPSHDDFRPRTAWSLYNAVTQVVKRRPPFGQIETLERLRGFVVEREWAEDISAEQVALS